MRTTWKVLLAILAIGVAFSLLPSPALAAPRIALPNPPAPLYPPLELQVTPSYQIVFGPNWRASWTVRISGGQGLYTLEVWFGDGGYIKRPGVAPGTYSYQWYYDNDPPRVYNQTWRVSGVGGPKYAYTQVNRASN